VTVSPGEIFQVCFLTRVDGWRTTCRGARGGSDRLSALVSGIGWMIGRVGG
jgi:hypothetical protein